MTVQSTHQEQLDWEIPQACTAKRLVPQHDWPVGPRMRLVRDCENEHDSLETLNILHPLIRVVDGMDNAVERFKRQRFISVA